VLRSCGANMDELLKNLTQHITEQTTGAFAATARWTRSPRSASSSVIQRAILHVQSSGKKEVTGANVLVAIFGEKDSHAVYFLQQQGITRLDVVNYISHGITKSTTPQPGKGEAEAETETPARDRQQPARQLHAEPERASAGRQIDPLIGRDRELERVIQTLCRRRKKQSAAGGRGRRRQDRDRRGPRAPHRRGQRARAAGKIHRVRARHGRAARGHQVPRAISSSA